MSEMDSQENTEPAEWSNGDSGFDCLSQQSQSQTQSEPDYWGRLYPLRASLDKCDLIANPVTFGKVDTDVVITDDHIPRDVWKKCSKIHFEIQRKQVNVMGAVTTRVVIIDRSSNGTFINGHILRNKSGVPRFKILKTNDIIGFPAGRSIVFEAYVFVDPLAATYNPIPHAVRSKYQVSLRLGAGAFGEVCLVFDKVKGKACAMKTIVKDMYANSQILNNYKKKLQNELDILQRVKHPNVIQLVEVMNCRKEQYIILEYMEGKDLCHRIHEYEVLGEDLSKLYFYQIAKGVQYLHSMGIIHRDLKPANILLSSMHRETLLKITDFGLSKILSPATMMKTLCGTKLYVAPEILCGGGNYEYTQQVDTWSLGVILFLCLSGSEPFASDLEIKEAAFAMSSSEWNTVSVNAKSLIKKMLVKDPDERTKINELFSDCWIQDKEMLAKAEKLYSEVESEHSETMQCESFSVTIDSTLCISKDDIESDYHLACIAQSPPPKKMKNN